VPNLVAIFHKIPLDKLNLILLKVKIRFSKKTVPLYFNKKFNHLAHYCLRRELKFYKEN